LAKGTCAHQGGLRAFRSRFVRKRFCIARSDS